MVRKSYTPEQIINMTGLREKLDESFKEAIARVRGHQDKSCEPPINESKEVDS